MILTSFQTTLFGLWLVKLSHLRDEDSFLIIAHNAKTAKTIVKSFTDEQDVVNFVNFLGEKYE